MTISQQRPYGLRSRKQVGWVSPVRESHLPQAWELAQSDAVANAFVLSRIDAARKDMWRLGGARLAPSPGGHRRATYIVPNPLLRLLVRAGLLEISLQR